MSSRLGEVVNSLGRPRILVIGDVILDQYLWGTVDRVSPEGPIPILRVERDEKRPGGAANVAMNLAALGAHTACAGVVGDDIAGQRLIDTLEASGVDISAILVESSRKTPTKTRCVGGSQQMLRVDYETRNSIVPDSERSIIRLISDRIAKTDLVIVSDYAKGAMTGEVLAAAISIASEHRVPIIVGPKGNDFSKYRGCTAVVPNGRELALATAMTVSTDDDVAVAADVLLKAVECEFVIVTRGEDGMTIVRMNGAPLHVRGHPRKVYDVTGAGDTGIATLGLALAADNVTLTDAVQLANVAGGLAVTKVGAAVVSRDELVHDLGGASRSPAKLGTLGELQLRLQQHRDRDETVVFTNGCFDILHIGHIRTLQHAKSQGDVLVIALNSDASVKRLKGSNRPIVIQQDRADVIAALEFVDYIVFLEEDTPLRILECLRPDVLVKGGDYAVDEVVGADLVATWGGRVSVAPVIDGASTTELAERIVSERV